jgi:sodium transport system permease protein
MSNIITIFIKELKDILRDRRTLMAMLLFPLLLVPAILSVSTSFQASQEEEAMLKTLNIAVINNGNSDRGKAFAKALSLQTDFNVIENIPADQLNALVKGDSLDAALVLAPSFDAAIQNGRSGGIEYYFNSTDSRVIRDRISGSLQQFETFILNERLDSLGISDAMIDPIKIDEKDVYTQEESIGKMIGGFLPYIFVLFCLMGAMYPTIDLFTGEKERGTMETILTVPANRLQILLGKMGVVVISGVISGLMAIVGMYIALKINPDAPDFFVNMINKVLNPVSAGLIIAMLIPLTTFFAGCMIPVGVYAKSFKEAQSMIQPAIIIAIVPLVIGMMPGIQLNFGTALIPILNVALASKEIIAGTINYGMLAVVFLSLIVIAGLGVLVSIRQFGKEGNILR